MEFAVLDTGISASTPALLASVKQLNHHAPDLHAAHMEGLTKVAEAFVEALSIHDPEAVVGLADEYGMRMAALGESCGCPIVTPTLRLVAETARSAGGAAKPSGAGGGDLAVAFFQDREGLDRFLRACKSLGFSPLRLRIGAPGLREEDGSITTSFGIGSLP
jgi:phosphomevalonate kinase